MKINIMYTFVCFVFLISNSCAQSKRGEVVTVKRDVNAFNKIHVDGNVEISYSQDLSYNLELEATSKDLETITAIVKDSMLVITKKGQSSPHDKHQKSIIRISSPEITELVLSNAAHFQSSVLSVRDFTLLSADGSDIKIDQLKADNNCKMIFSGGVDCEIKKMSVPDLTVECAKACDILLRELSIQNIMLIASGGTDVVLQGETDKITIHAGSGSDICIKDLKYNDLVKK